MGEFSQFALVPEQGVVPEKEQLDPQTRQRIEEMASRLNIRDNAAVMGFGARAQKEMGAFTDIALEQMLRQDIKPLEGVMQTLAEQIRSCSFTSASAQDVRQCLAAGRGSRILRKGGSQNQCLRGRNDRPTGCAHARQRIA